MNHGEGTFKGAGGLELFEQHWRPDGEPRAVVALVHGIGEHSGRYMNAVNRLVPRGYAVYGFDHRGHGRSPGQRGYIRHWGEYREDVRLFLDWVRQREPNRPLFLMGHSMGGLIVLDYGLHHPQGLVGVIASAPALGQTGVSPFLITLSKVMSAIYPAFSLDTGLDATAISRDEGVVKAYTGDPLVHSKATARLGAEMVATMKWTNEHAGEWRLPLLIVHGGADQIVPPAASQAFFERVPVADKERYEVEGGYHEPHNDLGWEQAVGVVERWLERHLPPA